MPKACCAADHVDHRDAVERQVGDPHLARLPLLVWCAPVHVHSTVQQWCGLCSLSAGSMLFRAKSSVIMCANDTQAADTIPVCLQSCSVLCWGTISGRTTSTLLRRERSGSCSWLLRTSQTSSRARRSSVWTRPSAASEHLCRPDLVARISQGPEIGRAHV